MNPHGEGSGAQTADFLPGHPFEARSQPAATAPTHSYRLFWKKQLGVIRISGICMVPSHLSPQLIRARLCHHSEALQASGN